MPKKLYAGRSESDVSNAPNKAPQRKNAAPAHKQKLAAAQNTPQTSGIENTKPYRLLGADGIFYQSAEPGLLGGHRKQKIYGRLDCKSANRWITKGKYVTHRVFFKDEETAIKAGYRPCAVCMPKEYAEWKKDRESN